MGREERRFGRSQRARGKGMKSMCTVSRLLAYTGRLLENAQDIVRVLRSAHFDFECRYSRWGDRMAARVFAMFCVSSTSKPGIVGSLLFAPPT